MNKDQLIFDRKPIIYFKNSKQEFWFKANDIAYVLGYADPKRAIQQHLKNKNYTSSYENLIRNDSSSVICLQKISHNDRISLFINKHGLAILLCICRKSVSDELISFFENTVNIKIQKYIRYECKETETLKYIEQAFKNIQIEYQIKCGTYRIDMVMPSYRIVIECDEHGHRNRDIIYEKTRETYIKNQGYQFVRYNPDDKYFSIFNVIGDINKIIINKYQEESLLLKHKISDFCRSLIDTDLEYNCKAEIKQYDINANNENIIVKCDNVFPPIDENDNNVEVVCDNSNYEMYETDDEYFEDQEVNEEDQLDKEEEQDDINLHDFFERYTEQGDDISSNEKYRIKQHELYEYYCTKCLEPIDYKMFNQYIKNELKLNNKVCKWHLKACNTWMGIKVKNEFNRESKLEVYLRNFINTKCKIGKDIFVDTKVFNDALRNYCEEKEPDVEAVKYIGITPAAIKKTLFKFGYGFKEWIIEGKKHGYIGLTLNNLLSVKESIEQFIEACCELSYGYKVKTTILWDAYQKYISDNKINIHVVRKQFYDCLLNEIGLVKKNINKSDKGFIGIKMNR